MYTVWHCNETLSWLVFRQTRDANRGDARQQTCLNHCQAKSENKFHFNANAALTAVNLAKIAHWLPIPIHQRKSFSMTDIKTMNHNALFLNRFISTFEINPDIHKNHKHVNELIKFGAIAA